MAMHFSITHAHPLSPSHLENTRMDAFEAGGETEHVRDVFFWHIFENSLQLVCPHTEVFFTLYQETKLASVNFRSVVL